ncbi:hypothetical protein AGR9A_Lc80106 [Agrobacterium salinitolerans str. Hayward 0363]|nr:hypothetical protein AGR9A_Lc80106 [Agrobacterium salinitolerans str. Hayward 0363]
MTCWFSFVNRLFVPIGKHFTDWYSIYGVFWCQRFFEAERIFPDGLFLSRTEGADV